MPQKKLDPIDEKLANLETRLRKKIEIESERQDRLFDLSLRSIVRFELGKVTDQLDDIVLRFRSYGTKLEKVEAKIDRLIEKNQLFEDRFDMLDAQMKDHDTRFDDHDKRFDAIDKRFDAHDKRFDDHDKRFDAHDKRFDDHDKRFDSLESKMDLLIELVKNMPTREEVNQKIEKLKNRIDVIDERTLPN